MGMLIAHVGGAEAMVIKLRQPPTHPPHPVPSFALRYLRPHPQRQSTHHLHALVSIASTLKRPAIGGSQTTGGSCLLPTCTPKHTLSLSLYLWSERGNKWQSIRSTEWLSIRENLSSLSYYHYRNWVQAFPVPFHQWTPEGVRYLSLRS